MSGAPVIPLVTKISSQIIRILGCNPGPMTLQGTNSYLLGSGSKRILLDTSDPDKPEYVEQLNTVLSNESASIETILLTHWHHDHIGSVPDVLKLASTKGCKVCKFPRTDAPDEYNEIPSTIQINKLYDGQEFKVEGATLNVLYTPGHSTDHVVITLKEENALFSGDCILGEGTAVFEDLYDYMNSLHMILQSKPSVIYPAHGNIINDPLPKIQYYIDHRNQRENEILNLLKSKPEETFTPLDIVKVIYKDYPENVWPAAAFNVSHHLKKLTKEGFLTEVIKHDEACWKYLGEPPSKPKL